MEYIDIVHLQCSATVYESVAIAGTKLEPEEEIVLFSDITSVALTAGCAYGVVGHLSVQMSPEQTDIFKANYLILVAEQATNLKSYGDERAQTRIKEDVAGALRSIIDEITKSHMQGGILAALTAFGLDMRPEIDERVDYKSLTLKTYMGDWLFNEYATCMGDPEGPARLAQLFAKSDAQALRNIFTEMRGKYVHGGYCLQSKLIQQLVRPYLQDNRRTADVLGDGPPVSHYARELLDAL